MRGPGTRSRLLAALAALCAASCGGGDADRPDVLLVVVDTLRADGLSCYGNPRATSPNLDRLAAEGARFEEVLAQAPNTATSHATLFTGLAPAAHGVANLSLDNTSTAGLPDAFETLAERFAEAGYRTVAITDGGPLGTSWNLDQGFEEHHGEYEGVAAKVDRALEVLGRPRTGRPLFLFLHTYQVHQPFAPPPGFVERFDPDYAGPLVDAVEEVRKLRAAGGERAPDGKILMRDADRFDERDRQHLRALYDGEVAYTDRELGRLLDALRSDGALERTLVAVTSDHGEEFGEHGEWGHVQLHRETLRVPLILRLPGDAPGGGRVVEGRAGLVDLHATLLAAAGLAPQPHSTGRDLGPALASGRVTERPRFASTNEHLSLEPGRYPWRRSVRRGDRALLVRTFPGPEERTLLAVEPGTWEEGDPLDAVEPRAAELARMIETHVARQRAIRAELLSGAADDGRRPLDARARDELGALGYVDEGD